MHEALREIFRVEVDRTTWELEIAPGTRVEVALDQGEVRNANGAEAVSEVEIEMLEGAAVDMFAFADHLVEAAPLRPSSVTKAQRGYRLAQAHKAAPVKSRAATLDKGMSPLEAARATIAAALGQLQANEAGALATPDPEYLHQMRVALRRLRSALRAFRATLDPQFVREADAGLKALARETGPARDWDVLATQMMPAFLETFDDADPSGKTLALVRARRRAAREAMRAWLRSPGHAHLVLLIARWLAQPQAQPAGDDLTSFAARATAKRHRKLMERARHAQRLNAEARHRLRIEAKRVRYVVEGFAPLFPVKPVKAYLKALEGLQDDLGKANDAVVAIARLEEIAMPAPAAKLARRWLDAQERSAAERLAPRVAKLADTAHFWEKA